MRHLLVFSHLKQPTVAILKQAQILFKKVGVPVSKRSAVGFDSGSAYAGCNTGVRARLCEFSPCKCSLNFV